MSAKNNCAICGKTCQGTICKDCYNKSRHEKRTARLNKQKEETCVYYCQHCGKQIPWDPSFKYRTPKYCSLKCAGHAEKHNHPLWHTKEEVIGKINAEIDRTGKYVTRRQLHHDLHISDKVLTRLGLKLTEINEAKGKYFHEDYHRIKDLFLNGFVGTLSEAREFLGITKSARIFVKELREKAGTKIDVNVKTKEEIENTILEYIKTVKRSVTTVEIINQLHVDHYCTLVKNGVSISELNEKAGYPSTTERSSYVLKAVEIFENLGIGNWEFEKFFKSLKSPTSKWSLKFDLYNRRLNILIEIDGPEHYKNSKDAGTVEAHERDRIKDKWAKDNGITLIRIPTMPYDTFDSRVKAVAENLKKLGER